MHKHHQKHKKVA